MIGGKPIGTPGSMKKPPPAPPASSITKRSTFKTTPLKKSMVPPIAARATATNTPGAKGPPPATRVIINPRVGGVDVLGEVWVDGSNVVASQMDEPVSIDQ